MLRRRGLPTLTVLIACGLFVAFNLWQAGGDPLSFVNYDGYFSYQIALRGFQAGPNLDVPAYRFQRILYPLLSRLLALGMPDVVPWTLIGVNVTAIAVGTLVTEHLLDDLNVSVWYALVYGLYGGQLIALRANLNEPLSQALVMLAMLAYVRRHWDGSMVAFAAAALAKETALIFWAAFVLHSVLRRRWRSTAWLAAAPFPFALYQIFLWSWLGRVGLGSGGAGATPFSIVPFAGWLQIAEVSTPAFLLLSVVLLPMVIVPTLAGLVLSLRRLYAGHTHPYILVLAMNALVILFLPHSTFREAVGMVRLIQGLVISLLLFGALVKSDRILNYSFLWIATNALWVKGFA